MGDLRRVYRRKALFAGNAAGNNKGFCDKRSLFRQAFTSTG
jgi:hypothetical protein